jgi:hypothetical protein
MAQMALTRRIYGEVVARKAVDAQSDAFLQPIFDGKSLVTKR